MERLSSRDLRALSKFLRDLYQLRTHDEFTTHLVKSLPTITDGEFTSYNEFLVGSSRVIYKSDQLPYCPDPLYFARVLEKNLHEHPIVTNFLQTNDKFAYTFSDFLSARRFRKTSLFNEFYRPLKMSFLLCMGLRADRRMLSISRHRNDKEFSDSSKVVFNAIHPHIQQALRNSLAVTQMRSELDTLYKTVDHGNQAVIYVTGEGRIRFSTSYAQRLLRDYGLRSGSKPHTLPTELENWRRHHRTSVAMSDDVPLAVPPLIIEGELGELRIRLIPQEGNHLLLLEQRQRSPSSALLKCFGLTKREVEILDWVVRGKTNPEIGLILGVSRRTVHKHLEHIYLKLGVENRMAAMAVVGNIN